MTNEQWQELVLLYGDNAYLMVLGSIAGVHNGESFGTYINFDSNDDVNYELKKGCAKLEIKDSAALPFDLLAAQKGDKVQIKSNNIYYDVDDFVSPYRYDSGIASVYADIVCFFEVNDDKFFRIVDYKNAQNELQMKHPRRVGIDYGEDK